MDSYRVRRIFKEKIIGDKNLFFTKELKKYGVYPLVSRFLITTSNAFKNFYCSDAKIKLDLKLILDSLHLPRFIWLVELINVNKSINNQVVGLLILDPNTPTFPDTLLFQYINGNCQVNTESSNGYNEEKSVSIKTLPRYTQNLNLF
ncbi:hypothetical protein Q4Q39_15630 [Flavivirga amylovorans]|uniref:Uncharacterized protein n=1 Tax=Flavivirga amylovorans TaxID=870486 RepID=A0ABT8X4D9_9FLAO|nr:hypothetical protein [Flavivirga amylovorans]MDO5988841.1 hypothetical protein [Flavivirga amylovorans]